MLQSPFRLVLRHAMRSEFVEQVFPAAGLYLPTLQFGSIRIIEAGRCYAFSYRNTNGLAGLSKGATSVFFTSDIPGILSVRAYFSGWITTCDMAGRWLFGWRISVGVSTRCRNH